MKTNDSIMLMKCKERYRKSGPSLLQVILKTNPEYMFSLDELHEILYLTKEKVKEYAEQLEENGLAKIIERYEDKDNKYDGKTKVIYVKWDGYL